MSVDINIVRVGSDSVERVPLSKGNLKTGSDV